MALIADAPRLSTVEGFTAGALGACVAVTFTNPMDVAKTRLQLDGELRSKNAPKAYRNTLDVLTKTARFEGLRACQRGLGAAYAYQFALNGSRLGFYEPLRQRIGSSFGQDPSRVKAWSSVSAGALSGAIGAIIGNPLFLIKARLQAYSPVLSSASFATISLRSNSGPSLTQYAYKSTFDGFCHILRSEGFKGLARGVDAAILRTAMGSSVQLPAYNYAKLYLEPYFSSQSLWLYFASSSLSGLCVLVAMQPADTTLTRMYNQSHEAGKQLYKNPLDCLYKTIKTEGLSGLYKGSTAHFLRIAPHTIITLVSNEAIKQWWLEKKGLKMSAMF
ncbi:hypothetical protein O181_027944 [Austropuccinia psidii MF-1]|uniref:Mitochondrial oxaloacetate transport protein n=1 Tax=Austropuccinia psidii MF-1 TaxID=1389203 RepID=A0A9Q3H333_9BASI|nr:hypothetical protein [Austropuccinia psidii MF-1]